MQLKDDIWFAWHPVRVDGASRRYRGRWAWLRRVKRTDHRVPAWGSVRTEMGYAEARFWRPTVARMYYELDGI